MLLHGGGGLIKNVRYDMGVLAGVNECKGKAVCVKRNGNICCRSWHRDYKYDDCLASFWRSAVLLFSSAYVR